MFNSPPGLSDAMDLAKMLAVLDLIAPLAGPEFNIWRQTRTGLLSYPLDPHAARAHLAASVYLQMALRPHIVHVVGHTEADHAATADDVIEACGLARRAIENAVRGAPDMTADPAVAARRAELAREAGAILDAVRLLKPIPPLVGGRGDADPLTDPAVLARAVTLGILDAPHLRNNRFGRGLIRTRITPAGACVSVDSQGQPLPEAHRLNTLLKEISS